MARFLVLMLSLLLMTEVYSSSCENHHCMAVVDAGSTGSRLHIFSYDLINQDQPVQIKEIWSKKIKPGLASINPTNESIKAYLHILLNDAPEQHLPLYFYATAGMRLISKPQQQKIYQVIRQVLLEKSEWQLVDLRTISGQEEGVLGWLAVNYQVGAIDDSNIPWVGVLDMGGASVQISFPIDHAEFMSSEDIVNLDIGTRHVSLYAHSFLGLGQTVMAEQFLDVPSCFISGYILPNKSIGAGDMMTCRPFIEKFINNVHDVHDSVKVPMLQRNIASWYTMGSSVALVKVPLFNFSNHQFTSQSLMEQADHGICHQSWQDLSNQYPTNEYLERYCLFSTYFYTLLVDGYGISTEEPIQFSSNSQDFDWSLGVVLQPSIQQNKNSF